jgi:tRNA A-37 threonylcarbamoyl transferase component Bud32
MARWLDSRRDGRESSETRAALEDHLETCAACRALVIELARETASGTARGTRSGERPAEAPPLEVGSRVGRYLVVDWLGAGGMGVVYRAYDPELHRQVALKVLRATAPEHADGHSRDRMRARLLDEARAAARVTHPNVITVHDAGTHEGQVYLAMELVSGQTLAQWVGGVAGRVGIAAAAPVADAATDAATEATSATSAASPIRAERRTPEAVLARFVAAGRGLAAIHAAGLVHGDFKPHNVLLGDDRRVCVSDFGLARELAERSSVEADAAADALPGDGRDRAAVVVGTPRYMAPELLAGHPADAASDQYAFCVALREALDPQVPAKARRVLARGLSPHPGDRFATMEALLAELVPRRRLIALPTAMVLALIACVVGGGLSLSYARRPPPASPCAGAEQRLAGVWDEPRRAAVAAAFASSTTPFAADVGREVMSRLDSYAREWTAMSTDSCAATRIRAVQSEELFDLRAACLAERARNLGALGEELLTANAEEQQKAVAAAVALPPLSECADAVTLRAKLRPPSDPTARAEAERVEHDLARAQTMLHLGAYRAANELARGLLPRAVSTGDRALEARVHLLHGQTAMSLGLDADADDALYEAAGAAEAAEDQTTKAAAWTVLTEVLANHQARFPEAERAGTLARAALSRLAEESARSASRRSPPASRRCSRTT